MKICSHRVTVCAMQDVWRGPLPFYLPCREPCNQNLLVIGIHNIIPYAPYPKDAQTPFFSVHA